MIRIGSVRSVIPALVFPRILMPAFTRKELRAAEANVRRCAPGSRSSCEARPSPGRRTQNRQKHASPP